MVHVIHTQRLTLRPLETGDADRVYALFNNWNVIRRLSSPPWPYTREDARLFADHAARNRHDLTKTSFAITRDGILMGCIDIRIPGMEPMRRGPILGYWLGEEYWGHGYMSEAGCGFLAYVFDGGVDVICSGAFADNVASLRVQEKLGFAAEGDARMFATPRGDHFQHINTALTRTAFDAIRARQGAGVTRP